MFDAGTKIELLASSAKKITKPRKGSIGYFCQDLQQMVIKELSLITVLGTVYFIRYGFEKRSRIEKKAVLFVFPSLWLDKDVGILDLLTKNLVNNIEDGGPLRDYVLDYYMRVHGRNVSYVPMVIARPVKSTINFVNLTDNSMEIVAWARSLLSNASIVRYLYTTLSTRHYTTMERNTLDAAVTTKSINSFIKSNKKEIITGITSIEELIKIIRPLEAFAKRRDGVVIIDEPDLAPLLYYRQFQLSRYRKKLLGPSSFAEISRRVKFVESVVGGIYDH